MDIVKLIKMRKIEKIAKELFNDSYIVSGTDIKIIASVIQNKYLEEYGDEIEVVEVISFEDKVTVICQTEKIKDIEVTIDVFNVNTENKTRYDQKKDYIETTIKSIFIEQIYNKIINNSIGRIRAIEVMEKGLEKAGIEYGDITIDENRMIVETYLPHLKTVINFKNIFNNHVCI